MNALNKNIKKIRTLKGMNQSEFAELFSLTRANIGSYEEGRAQPKMEVVVKMASHFELSLDDFVNKELSVNDLSKFQELPDNDTVQEEDHSNDFKSIPYVSMENFQKYLSIGRTKHTLNIPPSFDADFGLKFTKHYLDGTKGVEFGDVLLMKKIQPKEIQHGFIHAVLSKKELIVGICFIVNDTVQFRGSNATSVLHEEAIDSMKKVWRLTSTLSAHNTNYEYLILKDRIEVLEQTLRDFIKSHGK